MSEARRLRGGAARDGGRMAETFATLWLMLHGWRILGFRLKAAGAEIDLLARRGQVLAVIEVKSRSDLATALAAVTPDQQVRLMRAGQALQARRSDLSRLSLRLDLLALAPRRWPRHIANAWG